MLLGPSGVAVFFTLPKAIVKLAPFDSRHQPDEVPAINEKNLNSRHFSVPQISTVPQISNCLSAGKDGNFKF